MDTETQINESRTMTRTEKINYLDAIELHHDDDGSVTDWCHAGEDGRLYEFTDADLDELTDRSAYDRWCASYGVAMDDEDVSDLRQAAANAGDDETVSLCDEHLSS